MGGLPGQLAPLADGNERLVQVIGHGHSEQKAPGLQPHDGVELNVADALGHLVHRQAQSVRVPQHRGDIPEDDPRLGIVRDADDVIFHLAHVSSSLLPGQKAESFSGNQSRHAFSRKGNKSIVSNPHRNARGEGRFSTEKRKQTCICSPKDWTLPERHSRYLLCPPPKGVQRTGTHFPPQGPNTIYFS